MIYKAFLHLIVSHSTRPLIIKNYLNAPLNTNHHYNSLPQNPLLLADKVASSKRASAQLVSKVLA